MQLRAAIVGAGLMGHWHAHAIKKLGHQVVAVIDSNQDSAIRLARKLKVSAGASLEQILNSAAVDVVHVCTPLDTHKSIVETSLGYAKHVICEKPLTTDQTEASALLLLAQEKNLLLCPVHQFAFQRGVSEIIQEFLDGNLIPTSIEFSISSAGAVGKQSAELNRTVVEILPHPFSIVARLFPDTPLEDVAWNIESPVEGEVLIVAVIEGVIISVRISLTSRPTECGFLMRSDSGTRIVDLFHGYVVTHPSKVSRFRKIINPFDQSFRVLGAASLNLVKRFFIREPAYPGLAGLIGACYQAIQSGNTSPTNVRSPLTDREVLSVAGTSSMVSQVLLAPGSYNHSVSRRE